MSATDTTSSGGASASRDGAPRDGGPRDGGRRGKFGRFGARRREVLPEEPLDYKNVAYLARFVSANGRIQSRKRTGFSGQNQRRLAVAIKRARLCALMPFVGRM